VAIVQKKQEERGQTPLVGDGNCGRRKEGEVGEEERGAGNVLQMSRVRCTGTKGVAGAGTTGHRQNAKNKWRKAKSYQLAEVLRGGQGSTHLAEHAKRNGSHGRNKRGENVEHRKCGRWFKGRRTSIRNRCWDVDRTDGSRGKVQEMKATATCVKTEGRTGTDGHGENVFKKTGGLSHDHRGCKMGEAWFGRSRGSKA